MDQNESENAACFQLLKAISEVDEETVRALCEDDVQLQVPGARDVDLTAERSGVDAFVSWASDVHRLCGQTKFNIHRYFENGCELIASGAIHIQRHPRTFSSPCSILIRFEGGKVAFFQLLLDTYALEKFRGQMD
jgi:ketosteroid isomerase-like protein